MPFLDFTTGFLVVLLFGIAMILITWFFTKHYRMSTEDFLMAGRSVPWWRGAASIAASWIWAPALFISCQMAYQLGLPIFVYGNFIDDTATIVGSAIFILAINIMLCWAFRKKAAGLHNL